MYHFPMSDQKNPQGYISHIPHSTRIYYDIAHSSEHLGPQAYNSCALGVHIRQSARGHVTTTYYMNFSATQLCTVAMLMCPCIHNYLANNDAMLCIMSDIDAKYVWDTFS